MITTLAKPVDHIEWWNPTSKCCIVSVIFKTTSDAQRFVSGPEMEHYLRGNGVDFREERDGYIPNCVTEKCAGYAHHTRFRMIAGNYNFPWFVDIITIDAEACQSSDTEPLAVFAHEITHSLQRFKRVSALDGDETQAYVIEHCVNAYLWKLTKQFQIDGRLVEGSEDK